MKTIWKNNRIGLIFLAAVFLFFLLWFTRIYPIVISTTDDYYDMANHRHIFPAWHGSEPTRVFPEVFMPLVSQGASLLFRLFGGSILDWLTFGWAFWAAGALTALAGALYVLFRKAGASEWLICGGLLVFLLMHFWIFKQKQQDGNLYMLYSEYACTYFHYVIPNLMNAVLVVWLHVDRDLHQLFQPGKRLKKAFFVFYAYFCIFSNIWASMILAAWLGVQFVVSIVSGIRQKQPFGKWIGEHYVVLLLIALWLISQFFELNGQRAAAVESYRADSFGGVQGSVRHIFGLLNTRYMIFCILIIAGGLISLCFRKDRKMIGELGIWLASLALCVAYLLLSCSIMTADYLLRPDVFYGAFFFGALIVLRCFFELLRRFPAGKLIVPLLLIFMLVECNSMGRTYKDSVTRYRGETAATHVRINQDILDQLKRAEESGEKEVVLHVPNYANPDNWPYSIAAGEAISKAFHKYGVLKEEIVITEIIPDQEKNTELGLAW